MNERTRQQLHEVIERNAAPLRRGRPRRNDLCPTVRAVLSHIAQFEVVIVGGAARDGYASHDLDFAYRRRHESSILAILDAAGTREYGPSAAHPFHRYRIGELQVDAFARDEGDEVWECARLGAVCGVPVPICPYHRVKQISSVIRTIANPKQEQRKPEAYMTCIHLIERNVRTIAQDAKGRQFCGGAPVHRCEIYGECGWCNDPPDGIRSCRTCASASPRPCND